MCDVSFGDKSPAPLVGLCLDDEDGKLYGRLSMRWCDGPRDWAGAEGTWTTPPERAANNQNNFLRALITNSFLSSRLQRNPN